jgi:SSS family solute:Na+ symporter
LQILDWVIVLVLNGAIVLWGLHIGRGTKSTADWFLAAKNLPWWIVGFSLFATAVDSGDFVAIMGGAYHLGMSNVTMWWLGLPLGWFLVSYVVIVPIYRGGLYTNAEYLEYRFGPTARIMSAFIQLQQRTNVLGNVAFSLYLVFSTLTNWSDTATWLFVVGIALSAAVYTAVGGLRSVAITDSVQSVLMIIATIILFVVVWSEIGGWQGLEGRLSAQDPALVETLMHVGGRNSEGVPAVLLLFGFIVSLSAYCVINQSQVMRMLAARSEWDLRTAALLASAVTVVVMGCNISLGVLGHGLFPNLEHADRLYPLLLEEYLGAGLLGLVVAGLLAGGISTYDSVSSAVAAVLTRDVYARFLVKRGDDSHYLRVSRILTVMVIVVSFGYIPFLGQGMVMFYFRLATVAVIPLFTVYLMGVLTRVHRRSGTVGLIIGIGYGLSAFLGDRWGLPFMWTNTWWSYLWGILITSGAMVAASLVYGWETKEDIAALLYGRLPIDAAPTTGIFDSITSKAGTEKSWLVTSRQNAVRPDLQVDPVHTMKWHRQPTLWFILLLIGVAYVNLVVLW